MCSLFNFRVWTIYVVSCALIRFLSNGTPFRKSHQKKKKKKKVEKVTKKKAENNLFFNFVSLYVNVLFLLFVGILRPKSG